MSWQNNMQSAMDEANDKIEKLEQELSDRENIKNELEEEVGKLEDKIDDLQDQLKHVTSLYNELNRKLKDSYLINN